MHVRKHSERALGEEHFNCLVNLPYATLLEISTAEHQNEVKFLLCKSRILDTFAVKAHTIDFS